MLILVIMDTVIVVLLAGLVAGLLRSHADILRALHALGAGVGDPSSAHDPARAENAPAATGTRQPERALPLHLGPPLPGERSSSSAHDLEGVSPDDDAVAISVAHTDHLTLLAFLSSGCTTCAGFWEALAAPGRRGLPAGVRPVVVTKGPELEIAPEVRRLAPEGVSVVMSSRAWDDYEVPGSPFFVLVDGHEHRRVGEGVARHFEQVAELVRRAVADAADAAASGARPADAPHDGGRAVSSGLDGGAREALNDRELMSAGIHPGHPSLFPRSLDDVFAGPPAAAPDDERERGSSG